MTETPLIQVKSREVKNKCDDSIETPHREIKFVHNFGSKDKAHLFLIHNTS